jgi:hypothetical protein
MLNGSKKTLRVLKSDIKTLKTDKYRDIEWKNPWTLFRQGIFPIGLAIAYRKKHGYNPLRVCYLYLWLNHIRGFAWQWLIMSSVAIFVSIPIINLYDVKRLLQTPAFLCINIFTVSLIIFIALTQKVYKRSWGQMVDFRRDLSSFIFTFSSIFEDESSPITALTGEYQILSRVSYDMIRIARDILEGEIIGKDVDNERYELGEKSLAANAFGLGRDWSVYFDEARKTIDPYEIFDWKI